MSSSKHRGILELLVKGGARSREDVGGVEKAFSQLKTAIGLTAAAYGAMKAASTAMDYAEEAAKVNDVERAYKSLAETQGVEYTAMLEKMRQATGDTLSDMELMVNFNTSAMLGLPLERFDEMLQIARGASIATGQELGFMLQSITTGLGRQSKMILDNLGILISVEEAQSKFAASIGKTAAQLSDEERKIAFVNEALDKGMENLQKMGGAMGSKVDPFVRLRTEVEELKVAIGQEFLGVLSRATGGINEFVSAMSQDIEDGGFWAMIERLDPAKNAWLAGILGMGVGAKFGGGMGALIGGAGGFAGATLLAPLAEIEASLERQERHNASLIEQAGMLAERGYAILSVWEDLGEEDISENMARQALAVMETVDMLINESAGMGQHQLDKAFEDFRAMHAYLMDLLNRSHEASQRLAAERQAAQEALVKATPSQPSPMDVSPEGQGPLTRHQQMLQDKITEQGFAYQEYIAMMNTGKEAEMDLLDGSLNMWDAWGGHVSDAIDSVGSGLGQFQVAFQQMILAQNMSANSLGIALQNQLRQILAAKSAEAGVLALMELAKAAASAAMLDFGSAAKHALAAAKFGAVSAAAGLAASIGPPMGGGVGMDSGGSYYNPGGEEAAEGGGSRSIHVQRMAPTHINIAHSYYGNVYFGSQATSDAGSVQEAIDSDSVFMPSEVP